MRTTLELDDHVLAAARAMAQDEKISLGAAVSLLATRGLRAVDPPHTSGHTFPTFEVGPSSPPITLELVLQHRDD